MTPKYSRLTADERGALFELMLHVAQSDGCVRLREQEAALSLLDTMGFTTDYARDFYVNAVQARAAAASASPEARAERVDTLVRAIASPESRALALQALADLVAADGRTEPAEASLLADIRKKLCR